MSELKRKKLPLKWDVESPNFDRLFFSELEKINEEQMGRLPNELAFKVFKEGGPEIKGLNFLQKLYIWNVAFRRPIMIVIDGEGEDERVLSIDDFTTALKAERGQVKARVVGEDLWSTASFVSGGNDLVQALGFQQLVCATDIHKVVAPLAKRGGQMKLSRFEEWRMSMNYLVKMQANYEANKRRMVMDFGITAPEWYALIHFYDGEKSGSSFYKDRFKYALQCSTTNMKKALTKLCSYQFLYTRGKTKKKLYSISPSGRDMVHKIFDKLFFNF